jgi:hypothetical protein
MIADGHKMVLVEGIPTVFSWDSIQQFDGKVENNCALKAFALLTVKLVFYSLLFTCYFPRS